MLDPASQIRTWRDALTVGRACDEAIRGHHAALALGLHLAEAYRPCRARADEHVVLGGQHLSGRGSSAGPPGDTGPSFSRAPSCSVHAPGSGVQARISRSTTCAGSFQSTLASAGVIFGAKLTNSAGCGTASSVPASIPSSVFAGAQTGGPGLATTV